MVVDNLATTLFELAAVVAPAVMMVIGGMFVGTACRAAGVRLPKMFRAFNEWQRRDFALRVAQRQPVAATRRRPF
jgi:hypothetical protein